MTQLSEAHMCHLVLMSWMCWTSLLSHFGYVTMSAMASQITGIPTVCSIVYSGDHRRKYQSSASLVFVKGIQRWQMGSNGENISIYDVIMQYGDLLLSHWAFRFIRWKQANIVAHGQYSRTSASPRLRNFSNNIKIRKIFTDPIYKLLSTFTVILDAVRGWHESGLTVPQCFR